MTDRSPSFGLITPVVTLNPRAHGKWEESASIEDLRGLAVAADALGYDFLTASEHVAVPKAAVAARGARYFDPLATLGYLAALTEEIRLVAHVVVLPWAHPLAIAKRYATLDQLAEGRVVLGVGVGSSEEEFDLLGVDFAGRGPRFEEGLRALRAALDSSEPRFEGSHFRFREFVLDPMPRQERLPIWLGGRSLRSLRRALEWGEGWIPFGVDLAGFRTLVGGRKGREALAARAERGEPAPELIVEPERPLRMEGDGIEHAVAELSEWTAAGATGFKLRFEAESLAGFVAALEVFQSEVAARLRGG